jgi:CRISPR-associated endonuclease Cas1
VIGADGMVSLAALRWLADQKASFIMLDRDGSVFATTGPVSPSDARLRRAQSLAHQSGVALRIAKELIRQKLVSQEKLVRKHFQNTDAAEAVVNARIALPGAKTSDEIRICESRAALAYWAAWRELSITYPTADLRRVPDHWRHFGSRLSPLTNSPRLAANPPNAMLNYLYAMLESEARLALAALGLDPGIGMLHNDSRTRDSLACDLMEPIRPQVDAFLLDWLSRAPLHRAWFFEQRDGNCRLMANICVQLSQTGQVWRHAVAPWAELVARMLCTSIPKAGNRRPATPLTGDHRRAGRVGEHTRPVVFPPKVPRICRVCGVACEKTYCASCGSAHSRKEFDKGRLVAQSPESLARRSATQKAHVLAIRAWKPSKESVWLDKETYIRMIQPRLTAVTVPTIMKALSVSEPYALNIRAARCIPHPRHWLTLARLAGVSSDA